MERWCEWLNAFTKSLITSTQRTVPRSDKYPYPILDCAVESLHHGYILLALIGKVLDAVAVHQGMDVLVRQLFTRFCL